MLRKLSDISGFFISGLISLFFTFSTPLFSQNPISGIINKYSKVISVGVKSVTLSDIYDETGTPVFFASDTVMLMQMSGVVMNHNGNYQSTIGTPGAYEYLIVSSVDTGSDIVTFTKDIKNLYDPEGLVQLVTVPSYNEAVVVSLLTCEPWDSANGTGGVLTFSAKRNVTLNASIDVSGKGFKGGIISQGAGLCAYGIGNEFLLKKNYSISSNYSGYKGEGIANKIITVSNDLYPDSAKGEAPSFSGGGGGNGYSSGGGGGSGYGAGIRGLNEYEYCIDNVGFVYPGGYGGQSIALTPALTGRVFMGGGGGGSTYATVPGISNGGNGGGIIIIITDTISGNGQIVSADGATAAGNVTEGPGNGGGGGGGSVIIAAGHFSSLPELNAKGGDGGSTQNYTGCEGGGGGGGLIWTKELFSGTYSVAGGKSRSIVDPTKQTGEKRQGLVIPLNGFVYNAIYSSQSYSVSDSVCEGIAIPEIVGNQPIGGTAPYTYKWLKSDDGTSYTDASGSDIYFTPSYTVADTLWIRRIATDNNGGGIPDTSQAVRIIVHPKVLDNIVNYDETICFGRSPLALIPLAEPGGGNGLTYGYLWEKSLNSNDWVGTDSIRQSFNPGNLELTTYYRRVVSSGACVDISDTVKITVLDSIANNSITDNQVICQGTEFTDLQGKMPLSGGSGSFTYQWLDSNDGIAPGSSLGASYNPAEDTFDTIYFKRVVLSGPNNCCKDTSNIVTLVRHPAIGNNIISSPQTICSGSTILPLTGTIPTGGGNNYTYQWQKNGVDTVGVTSIDFQEGPVYKQTYYNRIVNSYACSDTSESVLVTVIPSIKAYEIDIPEPGHDTICFGTTPGKITGFTVSGGDNEYHYYWYSSADGFTDAIAATPDYQPGILTESVTYKRVVESGLCSEYDNIDIEVLDTISGNSISGEVTICNTSTPPEISGQLPSGGDGKYKYLWLKKDATDESWQEVSAISPSVKNYTPSLLDRETYYKRVVFSGENDCCTDTSAAAFRVKVDMMPEMTAGDDTTLYPFQFATAMKGIIDGAGIGTWTVITSEGDPSFDNDTVPGTNVRKLGFGENTFNWHVVNGVCDAGNDEVTFTVPRLSVPEGFSPNGDGQNDRFVIEGLEYTTNELVIINTGGAVVYKTTNYKGEDWEGIDNNGDELPEGTYYYLLTINGAADIAVPKYVAHLSGFIIIRR